tara:strand:+ start:137 stop:577 length:441 start_codon:yes stop_codon:yes gene_type:complete
MNCGVVLNVTILEIKIGERMESIDDRNDIDQGQLNKAIVEVAKKYTYQEFLDEDTIELCDDLLHVINTNPDYRYLRLFKFHELENEIVSFKEICFHKRQAERWLPWVDKQIDKMREGPIKEAALKMREESTKKKEDKLNKLLQDNS